MNNKELYNESNKLWGELNNILYDDLNVLVELRRELNDKFRIDLYDQLNSELNIEIRDELYWLSYVDKYGLN